MTAIITTPVKAVNNALLAHTQLATATVAIGSDIDVSTKESIRIYVSMGRTTNTALGNEILFRLECSPKSTGNDEWYQFHQWTSPPATPAPSSNN